MPWKAHIINLFVRHIINTQWIYSTNLINVTGQRIKHLWFEFRESNQAVAAYAPLTVIVCIPLIVIVTYGKMHANPVVKYYDHINSKC